MMKIFLKYTNNKRLKLIFFLILFAYSPPFLNNLSLNCQDNTKSLKSQTNNSNSNEIKNQNESEKENFIKGEEHFYKKRFFTSEIYFKKVIEINPENAYAHSYLGEIYLYNQSLDKAIYHLKIAAELLSGIQQYNNNNSKEILFLKSINPNQIVIPLKEYFRLAQAYYLKQDPDNTELYCNKIITKYPDFFQCYYYLGMIELEFKKNREKTLFYLKKYLNGLDQFIKENPDNTILIQEKEKVEYVLNLLSNKNNDIKDNLKKELDPLNLFFQTSNKSYEEKQKEFVHKIKEQKINLNLPIEKQFEPIWVDIQYYKNKDKKKTESLLLEYKNSQTSKTAKEHYYIRKTLCSIYFEDKDYAKSEKECLDALNYDFEPDILFYLSLASLKQNKKKEFYDYVKKYIAYKEDTNAIFLLAYELYNDKNYSESLNYFEKINQIQPNHKESLYYQFLIYKDLKQISLMKNIAQKMILYYPEDIELQHYIVFHLLENNEKEMALNIMNQIYKKTKSLNDGLILSGLYIQEENFQNAFQVLSELYQNYPEDYQLVRTLILLLTKMNRNFDTIETIANKFLKTSQNQEEKENIIKILPEEIRIKLINENNKKNDSQK